VRYAGEKERENYMKVSFNGYDEKMITFACNETVKKGSLVKLTQNGEVAACEDGDNFVGVAVNVRGGYAGVQMGGYISVPVSGSAALGFQKLSAASGSAVKIAASGGREHLVLDVSEGFAGILI